MDERREYVGFHKHVLVILCTFYMEGNKVTIVSCQSVGTTGGVPKTCTVYLYLTRSNNREKLCPETAGTSPKNGRCIKKKVLRAKFFLSAALASAPPTTKTVTAFLSLFICTPSKAVEGKCLDPSCQAQNNIASIITLFPLASQKVGPLRTCTCSKHKGF